ncbi:zinc-binding protein A33 [Amia ocellicauda]|uniref:zinc-binding protein A33 n=1 Tax=Amia ocellicauda TaxID=2972642 RepID=UPI0034643486
MDKCSWHQETLSVFCEDDKEALCPQCVASESHRGHTLNLPEKAVQLFQAEMLAKNNYLEVLQGHVKTGASSNEKRLTQLFERLQNVLQRSSAELQSELENERTVQTQLIQGNIQTMTGILSAVSAHIQSLDEMDDENKEHLDLRNINGNVKRNKKFEIPAIDISKNINSDYYLGRFVHRIWKQTQASKFLVHSVPVTLDPDTAHPELTLFEGLTCVRYRGRRLRVPDYPSRFDQCPCVLGTPGFQDGRHYWEVRVWNKMEWDLGMTTQSANRKGAVNLDPAHGYYAIILRNGNSYAACSSPQVPLRPPRQPSKIGIFLDYNKGTLSFLDANGMYPLYTFEENFTEKLYPFFSPGMVINGHNVEPLKVC